MNIVDAIINIIINRVRMKMLRGIFFVLVALTMVSVVVALLAGRGSNRQTLGSIMTVSSLLFLLVFTITALIIQHSAPENTDPRRGSVFIGDTDMTKICDGTTLVYSGNETSSVIPNSPECRL